MPAPSERLTLPAGQWAEIALEFTHGQMAIIRRAGLTVTAIEDPDLESAYLRAMLVGWSIRDLAGVDIPFDVLRIDELPSDIADAIFVRCIEIMKGRQAADPKGGTGDAPSPSSSTA